MPSGSERSFGQRYTKARGLVEYLKTIPTYAPDNPELTIANLTLFLDDVEASNLNVPEKYSALRTERNNRYTMYRGLDGVFMRAIKIREFICYNDAEAKRSPDYKAVVSIIRRMRGRRLNRKPINPPAGGGQIPRSISTSEQSFGSVLNMAKEILGLLIMKVGYAPTNPLITVAGFTTFLEQVDDQNSLVMIKYADYSNAVDARIRLYINLDDRVLKTRSALASQYGKDSDEYMNSFAYQV